MVHHERQQLVVEVVGPDVDLLLLWVVVLVQRLVILQEGQLVVLVNLATTVLICNTVVHHQSLLTPTIDVGMLDLRHPR